MLHITRLGLFYQEVPRVNVFRSLSCSQSIRQRIRRRTVTLFQSSLEFPDLGTQSSRLVQLDLFSPLRRTPLLQRSGLAEEWKQI